MTVIQSLWIGTTLSALQQLSIRSFLAYGHEYHLYAYRPIDGVPDGTIVRDASDILPVDSVFCYQEGFGKGSFSAFSNFFRYQLIFERGGWWADTDVICLRRFSFDEEFVIATQLDNDFTLQCATSVFKAPRGAPLMRYCADVVRGRDKRTLQWAEIGPILFDEAVTRFSLNAYQVPVAVFNPINWFQFRAIVEPGFELSRIADSYAVHLWNQMWKSENLDPEADPPSNSLYAILRGRYGVSR
jgi:hypothetical protein